MRVHELHGGKNSDRTKIVQRFSPFYNNSSPEESWQGEDEIDILVTTDVLAEGLNLLDSVHLINYDIHWNRSVHSELEELIDEWMRKLRKK